MDGLLAAIGAGSKCADRALKHDIQSVRRLTCHKQDLAAPEFSFHGAACKQFEILGIQDLRTTRSLRSASVKVRLHELSLPHDRQLFLRLDPAA